MLQILLILLLSYCATNTLRIFTQDSEVNPEVQPAVQKLPVVVLYSNRESLAKSTLSEKEIQCVSDMVYKEAVGEGVNGWVAVIHVALNRKESEDFPKNACDIIYQRKGKVCQYSWVCYRHNNYAYRNSEEYSQITTIVKTIAMVSNRSSIDPTRGSLYFKRYDTKNKWFVENLRRVARIGDHEFFVEG